MTSHNASALPAADEARDKKSHKTENFGLENTNIWRNHTEPKKMDTDEVCSERR